MNVGQTNRHIEDVPWQLPKMTIQEQMQYKFIACPEGNDVATNLKWVMHSNSLCIMPKPTCESWFMEGILKPGVHYAEVKSDFSDLENVMDHYLHNPEEAKRIITQANLHASRFHDPILEDIIGIKTLEKYFNYTNQKAEKYR